MSSLKDSTITNQIEDEPDTISVTLVEGTVVKIFVCGVIGVQDVTQLELFKRIIFEESTYGSACAALYNSLDVRVLEGETINENAKKVFGSLGLIPGSSHIQRRKIAGKLISLASSVIISSLELEFVFSTDGPISSDNIGEFLIPIYDSFASFESPALEETPFSGMGSLWQSPFIFIEIPQGKSKKLNKSDCVRFLKECCSSNIDAVQAYISNSFVVASSFDCTVAISIEKKYAANPDSFPLLFRVLCGDWFIHEEVIKSLRNLLTQTLYQNEQTDLLTSLTDDRSQSEINAQARLEKIRDLMRRFYHAGTFLSPADYGTEETDFRFIQTLLEGWKEAELKERVKQHMADVEALYQLEVDAELEVIEAKRAKREKLLNNGILWLGVLSVAGTVSGVLQFLDFDNSDLGEGARLTAIIITTAIAVAAFLYLQCIAGKRFSFACAPSKRKSSHLTFPKQQ